MADLIFAMNCYIRQAMSIEFLGNKNKLLDFIIPTVLAKTSGEERSFTDLFCGTGAVSAAFAQEGFQVSANDQMTFCTHFVRARLTATSPGLFATLSKKLGYPAHQDHYELIIETLNQVKGISGFIHQQYSPASLAFCGFERMYFSAENAMKIDGIREQIEAWKPLMSISEYSLLIKDLLQAVSRVSNTAGTFGCYLKHWKKKALAPLRLIRSKPQKHIPTPKVYNMDANQLAPLLSSAIVYADPPYTKRQYAAYYHILETIALYDHPLISGSTGLRQWMDKQSDYCYRRKAIPALRDMLNKLQCRHFFMSYSEDGQMPHEQIMALMNDFGEASFSEIQYSRYKSSTRPHKGQYLKERLYHLKLN